jgi:hypothetical protein
MNYFRFLRQSRNMSQYHLALALETHQTIISQLELGLLPEMSVGTGVQAESHFRLAMGL